MSPHAYVCHEPCSHVQCCHRRQNHCNCKNNVIRNHFGPEVILTKKTLEVVLVYSELQCLFIQCLAQVPHGRDTEQTPYYCLSIIANHFGPEVIPNHFVYEVIHLHPAAVPVIGVLLCSSRGIRGEFPFGK